MKYFFSLFILLCSIATYAQVGRFAPSAVKVGADPGTLPYLIFSEKRNFIELEGDIDIDRFFIVANYGISGFNLEDPTYQYSNDGIYRRIGVDINLMRNNPNLNIAFFGIRYGYARFSDELAYNTQAIIESNTQWPDTRESVSNDKVTSRWYELNAGLKVRVVKQLYMGFTIRYKLFMSLSGTEELKPYYIPGFGKNLGTSAFGLNYYISYRLPFRTKTIYTGEGN